MGLMFRRRPLMRLAGGAAVGTAAYQAGKRHEGQAQIDDQPRDADAAIQAPAPLAAAPPAADDTASEIERLASLHTSGALTDGEFTAAKAKLLGI